MSQQRLQFSPIAGLEGVFIVQSGPLACTAIRLKGGELCLYSPLPGLGEAEFAELEGLGEVSILLAPNHYHHRGIARHVERFPAARLICAPGARPRLQKQTGLVFEGLGDLSNDLPPTVRIVEPEGLKTGEIWMEIASDNDLAWIVCDGFSSEGRMPTMLRTFPKFGIRDRAIYCDWVKSQIAGRPPTILVPCHGAPVSGPDLSTSLGALLDEQVNRPGPLKPS